MSARRPGEQIRVPSLGIFGWPICFLFGIGVAYFGWTLRAESQTFVDAADVATGTVISLEMDSGSVGNQLYFPVIQFTDHAGELVSYRSATGANPPPNVVGDEIEVFYDRQQSSIARENSFANLWKISSNIQVLGLAIALIAAISFINSVLIYLGMGSILANVASVMQTKQIEGEINRVPASAE